MRIKRFYFFGFFYTVKELLPDLANVILAYGYFARQNCPTEELYLLILIATTGISYESLSSTLRKQVPELLNKYECKAIDFKVVIKGGKALLKAVPRK